MFFCYYHLTLGAFSSLLKKKKLLHVSESFFLLVSSGAHIYLWWSQPWLCHIMVILSDLTPILFFFSLSSISNPLIAFSFKISHYSLSYNFFISNYKLFSIYSFFISPHSFNCYFFHLRWFIKLIFFMILSSFFFLSSLIFILFYCYFFIW